MLKESKDLTLEKKMRYLMIILLITSLIGCATSGRKRRGSLSEAVEKTSDDYEGERKVHTEYEWEDIDYDNDDNDFFERERRKNDEDSFVDDLAEDTPVYFELKAGTGLLSNEHFYAINGFSLGVGLYPDENTKFGIFAGLDHAPVKETDSFSESLRNGTTIGSFGLQFKHLTTPDHTFIGNYITLGASLDIMGWSYKNPLTAYDDYGNTELINSDLLKGYECFIGTGLNLFNPEKVKFGSELTAGVIFWDWYTLEGFDNDLFNAFFYVKFRLLVDFLKN